MLKRAVDVVKAVQLTSVGTYVVDEGARGRQGARRMTVSDFDAARSASMMSWMKLFDGLFSILIMGLNPYCVLRISYCFSNPWEKPRPLSVIHRVNSILSCWISSGGLVWQ